MKVYVKKGDCQSVFLGIVFMFFFLICSIVVFIKMFTYSNFVEALVHVGIAFIFALIFFVVGLGLLYSLLKRPKKYSEKLVSKMVDKYNGKDIVYMEFGVFKSNERYDDLVPESYKCFTYDDNDLVINNFYDIYIKEFNWQVKSVYKKTSNDIAKVPNSTMVPVFVAVVMIMIFDMLLGILGMFYYHEYNNLYIVGLIISVLILFLLVMFFIQYERDNKKDNKINYCKSLKKYNILLDNNVVVGNLIIKDLAKYLLVLPLLWTIIIYILNDFSFANMVYSFTPILVIELIIFFYMLYYINYDDRLIKKHELNVFDFKDIGNIDNFKIIRPTNNMIIEKYFIIDIKSNNLLYNVSKTGLLRNKYIVYSNNGKVVAEIIKRLLVFRPCYVVRPIKIQPYFIRLKYQMQYNYEIIGGVSY